MLAATRELKEETGYVGKKVLEIGRVESNPAIMSNHTYTYLALDCEKISDQSLDGTEDIEIVKKNIEDNKGNVTRFLIMGSKASHPEFKKKNYITSCIFKVKNKPAALYKCLGGFATNNVNLSKLESFSDQNSFEQYLFICDIYGHIEDPKIQKSLEELGFHTVSLDILGVYEASEYRKI